MGFQYADRARSRRGQSTACVGTRWAHALALRPRPFYNAVRARGRTDHRVEAHRKDERDDVEDHLLLPPWVHLDRQQACEHADGPQEA